MSNKDGRILMMEKDFGPTCDIEFPATEAMAMGGCLVAAIDQLMALEKLSRNAGDLASNTRVQIHILQLCFKAANWDALSENILALTKKHGALKQATQKMIEEAVKYVHLIPSKDAKLGLVKTLRLVTEGKIHVEVERARLTRILSKFKEDEGQVVEAADILLELQVETYGSMDKREKADFLLEQMRLCLAKHDYTRTLMASRKVSQKFLNLPDSQDLKLRFYELMIKHYIHQGNYLEAGKCYRQLLGVPMILADSTRWQEVLSYLVLLVVLSPHDNEQSELIRCVMKHDLLEKMPLLRNFFKLFITNELILWNMIEQQHGTQLRSSYVFNASTDEGKKRWQDFHKRVTEHNLRVIAKWYTTISYERLTQLLGLPGAEIEEFISSLVSNKTIYAKIDRPAQQVSFEKVQAPEDQLNEWSGKIQELLRLLEKTTHLITKEEMIHNLN